MITTRQEVTKDIRNPAAHELILHYIFAVPKDPILLFFVPGVDFQIAQSQPHFT